MKYNSLLYLHLPFSTIIFFFFLNISELKFNFILLCIVYFMIRGELKSYMIWIVITRWYYCDWYYCDEYVCSGMEEILGSC